MIREPTEPNVLSDYDVRLIKFIASGMTYVAMGRILYLSPRTVANNVHSLCTRMGAKNKPHLVALAFHRKILEAQS